MRYGNPCAPLEASDVPIPISLQDTEHFRFMIGQCLGLYFDDGKLDFLADVLKKRCEVTGSKNFASYSVLLNTTDEMRELAALVTVGETYFFRNNDHFRAFTAIAVPSAIKRVRSGSGPLRILSAGCASGEEAYTISILLRECFPELMARDISICGCDINPAVIAKARCAHYSSWSLRETPADMRAKYFHPVGRDLELDPSMRASVSFEERNLTVEDPLFWRANYFDVVFCRNVTMYFPPAVMRIVIQRITRSLVPGGFLFLGHAETLRGISQDFHLCHTHDTFYYQKRFDHEARTVDLFDRSTSKGVSGTVPSDANLGNTSWFDIIHQASARIQSLAENGSSIRFEPSPVQVAPPRWDSTHAFDLLRHERYVEALNHIQSLPADIQVDPDARLLMAALLTNSGAFAEAEQACRLLLQSDELNAGAHYLMALCCEHAADKVRAIEHDQTALYLDASFAMPHLHMGLVAKRAGDLVGAKAGFERALHLLAKEDAARILLFGGGFTRDALIAFCTTALQGLGGQT